MLLAVIPVRELEEPTKTVAMNIKKDNSSACFCAEGLLFRCCLLRRCTTKGTNTIGPGVLLIHHLSRTDESEWSQGPVWRTY